MPDGQPAPEPGAQQARRRCFQGVDRGRHAPEEEVDPGLETDRRIRDAPDALVLGRCIGLAEAAAVIVALIVGAPPPGRIQPQGEGLDVHLVVSAHRSSRSQVARSAAAYVMTIPAPARTIAVTASVIARRPSSQPRSAAAAIIANSPET